MLAFYFLAAQVLIIGGITLLERWQNPVPTDWLRNIQCWALDLGVAFLVLPFFNDWSGQSLIDGAQLPFIVAFLIFLVVRDGSEFAFHVLQHKVGFLWKMHSLHHSDPEMSALTTNRHFWGDQLIKALTIWPLTSVIISQTETMLLVYAVATLYNYFIHANLKVDYGKWSWVLNCPAYHRLHHSRLPEHYNTNFAAMLPIFDVIFGTYRRAEGWPPTGQATTPRSFRELVSWPHFESRVDEEEQAATARPATA